MDTVRRQQRDKDEPGPGPVGPDGLTEQERSFLAAGGSADERQRRFRAWLEDHPGYDAHWLAEIVGAWPGEETDAELQAALKALD